jgi:hypothetical protein
MKSTTHTRKPNLNILALDRRDLPSVSLGSTGILTIDCGNLNDSVSVSTVGTSVKARVITTAPGASIGTVFEKLFPAASVQKVRFYGNGGNDKFTNLTTLPVWAVGGDGNDELIGGTGDDWFSGGAGNDTVTAGSGKDTILGSSGNDRIDGGSGNDLLYGGTNNDVIFGGFGQDVLYGEDGNDALYGGGDADRMDGGGGNDNLVSVGGGTDTVTGGLGFDSFWMDPGDILTDASATETAKKHVHRVTAFEGYSYDGGTTVTPVSKELLGQNLADPWRTDVEMELLYTKEDFSAKPLFASGGPTKEDVKQGSVGDCWLMAKLAAIADANPDYIRQMVTDFGDGTYGVRFYRNGVAQHIRVDADLWVTSPGNPMYAELGKEGSIWVAIVEKAWAFFRFQEGNYASIAGGNGNIDNPLLGMTGSPFAKGEPVSPAAVVNWVNVGSPSGLTAYYVKQTAINWLNAVKAARAANKPVTVGAVAALSNSTAIRVDNLATPDVNENTYRHSSHVYMVDKVLTNASGTPTGIKLYDPWGLERTITDMTRIYFCLSAGGHWTL